MLCIFMVKKKKNEKEQREKKKKKKSQACYLLAFSRSKTINVKIFLCGHA